MKENLPGGNKLLWEKNMESGEVIRVYKKLGEPGRVEVHNAYRMLSDDWTYIFVDEDGNGYTDTFYCLTGKKEVYELNRFGNSASGNDESGLDHYLRIIEKEGGPRLR